MPQDGAEMQDCERNAVRRWVERQGAWLAVNQVPLRAGPQALQVN